MRPALSVILPTIGPASELAECLECLSAQSLAPDLWELLIVDNAASPLPWSTALAPYLGRLPLRVLRCKQPGLHAARHAGLFDAKADCLVYLDDDMLPSPNWLRSYVAGFSDPSVGIATGPIRAAPTVPPPAAWSALWRPIPGGGHCLPALSLLDAGDQERDLPAWYGFGGNLGLRKSLILKGGGFRPDAFPPHLIWLRGDGETGLLQGLHRQGDRARYLPGASVIHRFAPQRLTTEGLRQRARKEGYSSAYSTLRQSNSRWRAPLKGIYGLSLAVTAGWLLPQLRSLWLRELWCGYLAYCLRYALHPDLRRWVKQPDYLKDGVDGADRSA